MSQQYVTTECEPYATVARVGRWSWSVTGVESLIAGQFPLGWDLGLRFTERSALRAARRWVLKVKRQRGWRTEARRIGTV